MLIRGISMDDSEAFGFRQRLGEYLDTFMPDIKTEASRRHLGVLSGRRIVAGGNHIVRVVQPGQ
jgi:hypothetical protein